MTFNEFVAKYNGKKWDFDGAYGAQCVDLIRFYWRDVFNIPQPKGVTGAKDFWTNYLTDPALNQNFDRVMNTPDAVPTKGDIVVWGSDYGQYGHIAIVTNANINSLTVLSQNDPIGRETHFKTYNYNYILGWFTPKGENMSELHTYLGVSNDAEAKMRLKDHLGERSGLCDWGSEEDDRGGFLGAARRNVKKLTADLNKEIQEHKKTSLELIDARQRIEDLTKELENCQNEDGVEWIANGKTVTTDEDGVVTTSINYKRK